MVVSASKRLKAKAKQQSIKTKVVKKKTSSPIVVKKSTTTINGKKDAKSGANRKKNIVAESKKNKTSNVKKSKDSSKQLSSKSKTQNKKEKNKPLPLTTKNVKTLDRDFLQNRPAHRGKSWSGNSESDASVTSALLDEDQCFECGQVTPPYMITSNKPPQYWSDIVLCDTCDGEYHTSCVGLDIVPRLAWNCHYCKIENQKFSHLSYEVSGPFALPKKKKSKLDICYSPSKPLELAFLECMEKGFMIVKSVFPYEVQHVLTHGTLRRFTMSGRVAEHWPGAISVFEDAIKDNCKNIINRNGRYDLRIPEFVAKELKLEELLSPITSKLLTIMGKPTPRFRTHNIVFAPVGSAEQNWHVDDAFSRKKKYDENGRGIHHYFTILIHLNPLDNYCGGTEIWSHRKADLIRGRPGDAFVFNGSLLHRGHGNNGSMHRFFYYASFSCRHDSNSDS